MRIIIIITMAVVGGAHTQSRLRCAPPVAADTHPFLPPPLGDEEEGERQVLLG